MSRHTTHYYLAILVFAFVFAPTPKALMSQDSSPLSYPETKKVDQVDNYFGVEVADPYRWLEDGARHSEDVANWVEAQNKVSFGYIETLPFRKEIDQRLTKLWDYEKYSAPFRRGDRYYFQKNDGLQNQFVLYSQESLDAQPKELIDPNKWSEDGTVALGGLAFSEDGKYLAYGVQESGSDWRTWRVMEIESGKVLEDELKWIKFGGASWNKDSKGFFYNRYDEPSKKDEFASVNLNQKVYYHELGTAQSEDKLIHADAEHPEWGFSPEVSEDGKWLVLSVWKGTDSRNQVIYKDLSKPDSKLVTLIDDFENEYSFLGNEGSTFLFKSDLDAPKKCILTIDINDPAKRNVIIAEAEEAMQSASIVGDNIILQYLKDAKTQVKLFDLAGKSLVKFPFPASDRQMVSVDAGIMTKRSTHSAASTSRRQRIGTTSRRARANCFARPKWTSTRKTTKSIRCSTTARTEHASQCSSLTRKAWNSTAPIQRFCMATVDSTFP